MKDSQTKKIIILIVILAVLAAGAVLFKLHGLKTAPGGHKEQPGKQFFGNITDLPAKQLPSDLPKDIIIEKDATVIHSYTATTPQNKQQSTVVYSTIKSPSSVIYDYTNYFFKNDWAVVTDNNTAQLANQIYTISAVHKTSSASSSLSNYRINVTAYPSSNFSKSTVSIILVSK